MYVGLKLTSTGYENYLLQGGGSSQNETPKEFFVFSAAQFRKNVMVFN